MKKFLSIKYFIFFVFTFLCSCSTLKIKSPDEFSCIYIHTADYVLLSIQKITDNRMSVRIYVEGDGNAYTAKGYATNDPTPKSFFLRDVAFSDPTPNVVYLARPCQFIKDKNYDKIDWTTGRFSQKIVDNVAQAIEQIADGKETVLIGYSGGALLTGLIINRYGHRLKTVKWITIAGLLNHSAWTKYFNYVPLKDSLDLDYIPDIAQTHYIAKKDRIIPYKLTAKYVNEKDCIFIEDATHSKGITINYND